MATRALARVFGLLGLVGALASPAAAGGDARALDEAGRVLTVGNWALVTIDGGLVVRVSDQRFLGWELRDEEGALLGQGVVPGSETAGVDASPVLSRNPATGEIWLAWSRQETVGAVREIALLKFASGAWAATGPQSIAADTDDQLEPSMIHDESGRGWLAWADGLNTRTIRFLGLASDGRVLGSESLSEGISEGNGAPSLGIDAVGNLFVAYVGAEAATGEVRLFVLTPNPIGGGVTHVPNPIIELGLRASVPAATIGDVAEPGAPSVPGSVRLTVLGGTPVAWWTESDAGSLARFRYVAEGPDGWRTAVVRTIDLSSGTVASIPDALALVEARLRRVIEQSRGATVPVIPGTPGTLLGRGGLARR